MSDKQDQFLELLKTQHTFPGPYTIKFIGLAEGNFTERVVASVRAALGSTMDPPYTTRPSRNDTHVSVTLQPIVSTPEQVVAIYEQVKQVRGLCVIL
jgi:putative lipoic acid-binding regulatory protein